MCGWSKVVVLGISMLLNTFVGTAHRGELKMRHGKSSVTSVCNLADGKQFISASYDGTVIMWDMVSGKPTWQVDLDEKSKSTDSYTIFPHSRDGPVAEWRSSCNILFSKSCRSRNLERQCQLPDSATRFKNGSGE